MKFLKNPLTGAMALLLLFSACTKEHGKDNSTGNNGGTAGPLFTDVKNVLQANCALSGCHAGSNPQNGIDFNNDAHIIAQKSRIKLRAVDEAGTSNQMPPPPSPSLSAADQKKITDWITAGGELAD